MEGPNPPQMDIKVFISAPTIKYKQIGNVPKLKKKKKISNQNLEIEIMKGWNKIKKNLFMLFNSW